MGFFSWILRLLGLRSPQRFERSDASSDLATAAPPRSRSRTQDDLARLDAGRFAPLSDADVERQARGLGMLWTNPWFGRRDLIPPADDRRTLLIDRGMVGQGLVTPEELAQIHAVGAEMDKEGFGACTNTDECEAACPAGISVANIARLNREYLKALIASPVAP